MSIASSGGTSLTSNPHPPNEPHFSTGNSKEGGGGLLIVISIMLMLILTLFMIVWRNVGDWM